MNHIKMVRYHWLSILSTIATIVFLFSAFWIIGDIFHQGVTGFHWSFLVEEPIHSGRQGGIFPILLSTMIIVFLAIMFALPIGVFAAVFLFFESENGSFMAKFLLKLIDILASTPSIVFGLFGNAFFVLILKLGFSLLTGGLTLACMILPTVVRTLQIGLQSISIDLRRTVDSLGLSPFSIFKKIIFPLIIPSLVMGVILGIARSLAETAALLFTSGYVVRIPQSILDSGRALSVHIYELAMNIPGGNTNAYASALVLITLLFIINSSAMAVSHLWMKKRGYYEQ